MAALTCGIPDRFQISGVVGIAEVLALHISDRFAAGHMVFFRACIDDDRISVIRLRGNAGRLAFGRT